MEKNMRKLIWQDGMIFHTKIECKGSSGCHTVYEHVRTGSNSFGQCVCRTYGKKGSADGNAYSELWSTFYKNQKRWNKSK